MGKIEAAHSYTDADLLALWREADAALTLHQSYQINIGGGTRMLTHVNAREVRDRIEFYERRIAEDTAQGPAVNYARLTRR